MTSKRTIESSDIEHQKPKKPQKIKLLAGVTNKILLAARFARLAHDGQLRKYSGFPYITHPARVASRVMLFEEVLEDEVVAAWLHDTIEDCGISYDNILAQFGKLSADLVLELTNPSKGCPKNTPREEKKLMDLAHTRTISDRAKRIKLVDRLDNCLELNDAPIDFIRLYNRETLRLIDAIGHVDPLLNNQIKTQVRILENIEITRNEYKNRYSQKSECA
jgi:(p)ppGpp synthase/HD superfamily hydrolase